MIKYFLYTHIHKLIILFSTYIYFSKQYALIVLLLLFENLPLTNLVIIDDLPTIPFYYIYLFCLNNLLLLKNISKPSPKVMTLMFY